MNCLYQHKKFYLNPYIILLHDSNIFDNINTF